MKDQLSEYSLRKTRSTEFVGYCDCVKEIIVTRTINKREETSTAYKIFVSSRDTEPLLNTVKPGFHLSNNRKLFFHLAGNPLHSFYNHQSNVRGSKHKMNNAGLDRCLKC
jgi:hypothetical protein